MRLLPDDPELGWTPYAWLVYLSFPLAYPLLRNASASVWAATLGSIAIFLVLYFRSHWLDGPVVLVPVSGMVLLAFVLGPSNPGAGCFVIYGAAFCCRISPPRFAVRCLLGLVAVTAAASWALGLGPQFWAPAILFSLLIGGVNIHFAEVGRANARLRATQEQVERLAKTAERERIGRDLHDLLGHTLSIITLKSELAAKLVSRDPEAAGREIREVERISREALREVRTVVSGYRSEGLQAEMARARLALESSGVRFEYFAMPVDLDPAQETALAFAVREAATNVVRHSRARTCRVRLEQDGDIVRLEVQDDGRGGTAPEGMGLQAMRERVIGLGGTFERSGEGGVRITVTLPRRLPARAVPERPERSDPLPDGLPAGSHG